jgi:hypothetical protein
MALVDKKLTELTEILSVPDNAFIHVVDPNDVSQSPQGSSYKAKKSTIGGAVKAQVTVSGTVKVDSNNADPIVYLKGSVDALLSDKQDTLVNGINIASINSQNLLNGGNIEIATNTSLVVTNDATTNRVLSILDANTFIVFSGGNTNLTIPLNTNVGFEIGTKIEAFITGAVRLNVVATSGVSIVAPNGLIALNQSTLLLTKIAVNTWYVNIIPKLFLSPDAGFQYSATLSLLNASFISTNALVSPQLSGDGGGVATLRALLEGGVNNRWESTVRLRLAAGLTAVNEQDLTPKSYVDASLSGKIGGLGVIGKIPYFDSSGSITSSVLTFNTETGDITAFGINALGIITNALQIGNALGFSQNGSIGIVSGANALAFSTNYQNITNGTEHARFDNVGNFGINKTAPTEKLDVVGNIQLSNLLKLGQFTTATEPAYVKGASFFNTTLNKMRVGGATAYETVTSS